MWLGSYPLALPIEITCNTSSTFGLSPCSLAFLFSLDPQHNSTYSGTHFPTLTLTFDYK